MPSIASPIPMKEPSKVMAKGEIIDIATDVTHDIRDRALLSILYLSNSRVGEIVGKLQKRQVFRQAYGNTTILMFSELETEKNKAKPRRNIPVNIQREESFIKVIEDYLSQFSSEDIIFPIGRKHAWRLIKNLTGKNPHYFRHCRLTHLTTEYGLRSEHRRRLAGWSDLRPDKTYVHLEWQDIADAMVA